MRDFKLTFNSLGYAIQEITKLLTANPNKKYRLSVVEWKKRSLSANSQQHVFYKAISDHTGEDIKTVACRCKRDFGLPILLSDDQVGIKLGWMLDKIGFYQMSDIQQIKVMDVIQVTSLMNSKQHSEFRDNLIFYWNDNGLTINYLEQDNEL